MNRIEKDAIISNLKTDIESAKAVFLTNLIGVTSNTSVGIRKQIREVNGKVVVTRNTLFQKASLGTYAEDIMQDLKGPTALAFAFDDVAAVAKVLKESGEEHEIVKLGEGYLGTQKLTAAEVIELASLPSRDEMLGTLLATFNAPISAFARIVNTLKDKCEDEGVEAPGKLAVEVKTEEVEA